MSERDATVSEIRRPDFRKITTTQTLAKGGY
jgi:hypothetical protein